MDVYYLCSSVFVFLLKRKNKKTENSVKIYATLVLKKLYWFIKVIYNKIQAKKSD